MKKKWVWMMLVLVAVLLGIGVFAWWYISTQTNHDLPLEGKTEIGENEVLETEGAPDIALDPLGGTVIQDRPPSVGLETSHGEIVSCTFATIGTYSWTYEDENGTMQGLCVDSSAPTEWKEIATIKMEDTEGKIKLCFSDSVLNYSICYWIENATCGVADPVTMEGDTIILSNEIAKGIYEIHVEYPNGDAYYGFKVE